MMFLLSRWAGGLVQRYGARLPLIVGPVVAARGLRAVRAARRGAGSYWTSFFPAVMLMSLGMAASVAPLTTTVMGAVEERHAGIASGINNAVSRTAGLVSIAVLRLVMTGVFARNFNARLQPLNLPAEPAPHSKRRRAALPPVTIRRVEGETKQLVERAVESRSSEASASSS